MAILAGALINTAQGFVLDRAQSIGVNNLNIPTEIIKEVGNWQSVGTILDTPDLGFSFETLDVSCEAEALVTGVDPTTLTTSQAFTFDDSMPVDVVSPWKNRRNQYAVTNGVATPNLTLENVGYRFGVGVNSSLQMSFKGDTIIYTAGAPVYEEKALTTGVSQTYTFSQTPTVPYVELGKTYYGYGVCVRNPSTKAYQRLFLGTDYTNTATGVTVSANWVAAGYTRIGLVYATTASTTYPQSVHQGVAIKPAAVRGYAVDVYLQVPTTTTYNRISTIQTAEINRTITLTTQKELGSTRASSIDYDTPEVKGSVVVKPVDVADFFAKLRQITGVVSTQSIGAYSTLPLGLEFRISDPITGTILKTVYTPDARFTIPGEPARVNQQSTFTLPYSSDSGQMIVYNGVRV